jgi:xanthine permease XanP
VFIGCFPIVGGVLQAIPKPVLGGATLVMFAMVAVGGLKLLASYALDRRSSLVTACALGIAIGVMMVPQALAQLPSWLENILLSPVTSAGLTAVILELTLPGKKVNDISEMKPTQKSSTPVRAIVGMQTKAEDVSSLFSAKAR